MWATCHCLLGRTECRVMSRLSSAGSLGEAGKPGDLSAVSGLGGGAAASCGRPLLRASPWACRGAGLSGPGMSWEDLAGKKGVVWEERSGGC